jgi:hypothetical protein
MISVAEQKRTDSLNFMATLLVHQFLIIRMRSQIKRFTAGISGGWPDGQSGQLRPGELAGFPL